MLVENCEIPLEIIKRVSRYTTKESDIVIPHAVGIVINAKAMIGKKVGIFQNVTIGDNFVKTNKYAPIIKDGAIICAGAIILGKTTIGKNSIIGAGSVVVDKQIPENEVWAGNPAKFIRKVTKEDK